MIESLVLNFRDLHHPLVLDSSVSVAKWVISVKSMVPHQLSWVHFFNFSSLNIKYVFALELIQLI